MCWVQNTYYLPYDKRIPKETERHDYIGKGVDVVVKRNFPLLSVGWYLFRVVIGNRYVPRSNNENALYITSAGNVFVARWVIPLVTIPLLDLVRFSEFSEFREIHLGKTLLEH